MSGWDWAAVGIATALPLSCVFGLTIGRAIRALTPQTPAGGEDPAATPRTAPGSPRPGLIPPPDVTHPGRVVRLAVVYDCGTGYCGHVWRPERGWKHQHSCTPATPTPDQMDWWAAYLWDVHTGGEGT